MFCHVCGNGHVDEALFCSKCGVKLHNTVPEFKIAEGNSSEKEAILHYFNAGFVLFILQKYHGVDMSLRTLKRRLREYGADRIRNTNDLVARTIIAKEVSGPSSLLGYRSMWNLLKQRYKINIPRDSVMHLLKEIDPQGTESRKSRRLQRRVYNSKGKLLLNYLTYLDFCYLVPRASSVSPSNS